MLYDTRYPASPISFALCLRVVLISRRMHAAFMHDALNQTFLVDLGSTHGTFIGLEQLKPYTPTLVTKKSLIRFGTCEIQYLLVAMSSEESIVREAMAMEDEIDRELYLNTQFNLINMLPTDISESDLSFARLDTFNFVNPPLRRVKDSSDSVATSGDERVDLIAGLPFPLSISANSFNQGSQGFQGSVFSQSANVVTEFPPSGVTANTVPVPLQSPLMRGFIQGNQAPVGAYDFLSPNSYTKSSEFVYSGNFLPGEHAIKRCATVAGVDEQTQSGFASSNQNEPDDATGRCRRRRMSEDPHDVGSFDSSVRSISMSMDGIDVASIGGSSTGFISSGSMSECEESDEAMARSKMNKKVRFWDIPSEIPAPFDMI